MKFTEKIPSDELRSRLGLRSIKNVMRREPLRWYSHIQRMDPDTWLRRVGKTIKLIVTLGSVLGRHGWNA